MALLLSVAFSLYFLHKKIFDKTPLNKFLHYRPHTFHLLINMILLIKSFYCFDIHLAVKNWLSLAYSLRIRFTYILL